MIKVGITGGMGSGKSVVCDLFRLHGIPVFDADKEAKFLNDTSPHIRKALIHHFGEALYKEDRLDRKKLADLIFADPQKLSLTNSIIHPVLGDWFLEWCKARATYPVVAIDAAVLFEAGFERYVDQVITVFAPKEVRIQRVTQRDNTHPERVEARMQHQLPEQEKVQRAHHVIHNDGHHSLIQQVDQILKSLSHNQ